MPENVWNPLKRTWLLILIVLLAYLLLLFLQATAEANNLAALASSKDSYTKSMEHVSYSQIIR